MSCSSHSKGIHCKCVLDASGINESLFITLYNLQSNGFIHEDDLLCVSCGERLKELIDIALVVLKLSILVWIQEDYCCVIRFPGIDPVTVASDALFDFIGAGHNFKLIFKFEDLTMLPISNVEGYMQLVKVNKLIPNKVILQGNR